MAGWLRAGDAAGAPDQCLRRNKTTSTTITMSTIAPKPINMPNSSRICQG
jgi:hypothetical protein